MNGVVFIIKLINVLKVVKNHYFAHNVKIINQFSFGSEDCRECSNYWAMMFPVVIGLTLIVVLIVLVLNIDIYDNYLNSVLFFYQIAYLLRTPTQMFDKGMRMISGILNLNGADGLIYFCLYDGMDDMWKMVIKLHDTFRNDFLVIADHMV